MEKVYTALAAQAKSEGKLKAGYAAFALYAEYKFSWWYMAKRGGIASGSCASSASKL